MTVSPRRVWRAAPLTLRYRVLSGELNALGIGRKVTCSARRRAVLGRPGESRLRNKMRQQQ